MAFQRIWGSNSMASGGWADGRLGLEYCELATGLSGAPWCRIAGPAAAYTSSQCITLA